MEIKSPNFKKAKDGKCDCPDCMDNPMNMELCKEKMCMGTPNDIAKLIMAGYASVCRKVVVVIMKDRGNGKGQRMANVKMVQLIADENGCALYKDGKCMLKDVNLIPLEGKLHQLVGAIDHPMINELLFVKILADWCDDDNKDAVNFCLNKLGESTET